MATVFDEETLNTIENLYSLSKPYADVLGIDPFLAIGGPAEEFHSIRSSIANQLKNSGLDTWVGGFPDWVRDSAGDWVAGWMGYSHEAIERDFINAKAVDQTRGVGWRDKKDHPVLADLGVANIKLATAIDLLERYNKKYPRTDPLISRSTTTGSTFSPKTCR